MTEGNSQGLFIVVAIVIFGIFVAMTYTVFGDTLQPALVSLFGDSIQKDNFDKDADYNVDGVIPNEESDFVFDNVDTITGYVGTSNEVVIPKTINDKEVTTISGDAFDNKGITKLIMPNSLTTIEDGRIVEGSSISYNESKLEDDAKNTELYNPFSIMTVSAAESENNVVGAFSHNTIKEISFSANLKYIGSFAFFSGELDDIILPEGLLDIGESSFEDNVLKDITIPSTVVNLGNTAFKNNNLKDVNYTKGIRLEYTGGNVFSGNDIKEITIPKGTDEIADNAYSNAGLERVTIPNGTKKIGKNAFSNNQLSEVSIPSTVTEIDNGAFKENVLTNVDLPEGLLSIGDYAFYKNLLPVIKLPESLLKIGTYAFYQNELKDVKIPSKLDIIKEWTFAYNKLPSKPTIPSNIITEEDYAFYGNLFSDIKTPSDYYDGDNVDITEEKYFIFNKSTGTITDYIGTNSSVVIPYEIDGVTVENIGAYAFNRFYTSSTYNNISVDLTSVTIPNTVLTIGDFAFASHYNSPKLTSLDLGTSVKSIGQSAFRLHNLSSVRIPDSVEVIADNAFLDFHKDNPTGDNYSMKTLTLGSSLKTIGSYAFAYNNLTTVTIPESVKTIGSLAFSNNTSLTTVNVSDVNTSPLIKNPTNVFSSRPNIIYNQPFVFNTNTGTITDYWGKDTKVIIPSSINNTSVKHIGAYAFNRFYTASTNNILVDLTSVTIPNTVLTIGDFAFASHYNSPKLTSLDLGTSVKSIGQSAFRLHNLSSVRIPDSVEVIADNAFLDFHKDNPTGDNYSMKTLTLGSSLKTIGSSAFAYNNLTTVTIPKSVVSLSSTAFDKNIGINIVR